MEGDSMIISGMRRAGFLITGVILAAMITTAKPSAAEEIVDRIVAIVNNDIILQSEVNRALAPYIKNIKERGLPGQTEEMMLSRAHEDIFNNLINEKLTTQKAAELGIVADDKEVNAALEQMKTSMLYSEEAFQSFLKETGLTADEYRIQIKNQILKSKLLRMEIKSKTVVTSEEIEAYYQKSRDEFVSGTQYHLKHIIMQVPKGAGPEEKAAVRAKIEEIHQKIKEGTPFESMAEQYSQSSFANAGGDIGSFAENDLADELKETIIRTGEGDITPVMETNMGYQIFYIQSIIKSDGSLNDDVAEKIREKLYNEKLDEKFNVWIKELRDSADIKIIE
jgi:peptidyl-prolyl cis-trans isomerase SurA